MRPTITTAHSGKRPTITTAIATITNATATIYVHAIATTAKTTTTAPFTMPPRATPTTAMPSLRITAAANRPVACVSSQPIATLWEFDGASPPPLRAQVYERQ